MNVPGNITTPFRSSWMAGFECSDKLNKYGNRVNLIQTTGHNRFISEDYANLQRLNISTVREGICWSKVEYAPYQYDWSWPAKVIEEARRHNIQVIWGLCHFGFPDDLTPLHPLFARRFTALCKAFIEFYRRLDATGQLIIIPINEVSFLSWLGGDVRATSPYCMNNGWEVKYMLMKAYIEGVQALKQADPSVKILTSEPLVNMVPFDLSNPDHVHAAAIAHDYQYQVIDILTGRICPELNGRPEYMDIAGLNYYYNNQWIHGSSNFLPWANESGDMRWKSLCELIREAHARSGCPVILSETGHSLEHRPNWITYVAEECHEATLTGVPFWGICLYPIVDRPDWDDFHAWHHSGIWDIYDTQLLQRQLYEPAALAILDAQKHLQF